MPRPGTSLTFRVLLRTGVFMLVTLLVLYPNPLRLVENIARWSAPNALIDPDNPAIDELAAAIESEREALGITDTARTFALVNARVYERIPYAYDWDVWGVADYLPTLEQTMRAGREDCDGQAIVAASVLQRMGYDARIVTDGAHVWVWTPAGETMSPQQSASEHTIVRADETGSSLDLRAIFSPRALFIDWPTRLAYGVSIFPIGRELVIVCALWAVLLRSRPRFGHLLGLGAMLGGLLAMRALGTDLDRTALAAPGGWFGLAATLIGAAATLAQKSHPPGS